MASGKDNWVRQAPKAMALGEALAYTFDFSSVGTPGAVVETTAFNLTDYSDDTSTVLTGSTSINGDVVTFKLFTPALANNYRLICGVTITGNTVWSMLDVAVFDPTPDFSLVAVGANSYGTPAGVASWVSKYTSRSGAFDDTTKPTLQTVVNQIDQISSMLNAGLATVGFTVPVTDSDVTPMLISFVEQEVAAIVEGMNGSGRLGPRALRQQGGASARYDMIQADVMGWIEKYAIGIEEMGAARSRDFTTGLGFRDTDESGDTPEPLFQREGFGETYKLWDQ